jgi:hypothetical protein
MTAPFLATAEDVLNRCNWFLADRQEELDQSTQRHCVETALREIVGEHDWKCLKKIWRVQLSATQTTGTVTYQGTGGTYDYQCTLTGATWPLDVVDYELRLGPASCICDVATRISDTIITLKPPRVPAADSTASSYMLGKSWYALPPEFAAAWSPAEKNAWFIGQYVPFEEMYLLTKYRTLTGIVKRWSIGPAPDQYGTMAIYVYPWSMATEEEDLLMKFRPRTMNISGRDAWNFVGTVSVAAGGTAVTGTNTAFRTMMQGSIIRFAYDSATKPTATNGANPYVFQQSIASVDAGAQTLVLSSPSPVALSGVRYTISDPVDLPQNMYDAFLKNVERQLAFASGMKEKELAVIERYYTVALQKAKAQDSPVKQRMVAGQSGQFLTRLRDFKSRPWIS